MTYPLLALTPVFVVPVEWVLLDEIPGRIGLVGIVLAVLGVYLVHPLVLDLMWMAGMPIDRFPWWIAVPALSASVAFLSLGVVLLLQRLPLLRRTV
jgi:surface polysaccharide O-acyltransferase-like enzyme